jgi:hypothetical protein
MHLLQCVWARARMRERGEREREPTARRVSLLVIIIIRVRVHSSSFSPTTTVRPRSSRGPGRIGSEGPTGDDRSRWLRTYSRSSIDDMDSDRHDHLVSSIEAACFVRRTTYTRRCAEYVRRHDRSLCAKTKALQSLCACAPPLIRTHERTRRRPYIPASSRARTYTKQTKLYLSCVHMRT